MRPFRDHEGNLTTFGPRHDEALRYHYHPPIEAVGLSSAFGALCERLAKGHHRRRKHEPAQSLALDEPLPLEAWACWSASHDRRSGERARRALAAIDGRHHYVLSAYYRRTPGWERAELGPLSMIAHCTVAYEALAELENSPDETAEQKARRLALIARVRKEAPELLARAREAFAQAYDERRYE